MNKRLFKIALKEKRLRLSYPRVLIYQELSQTKNLLSPQELYQSLIKKHRKIGLTSIYRVLELLESLGMAFKVTNGSSVKYRLCESKEHHHHILCKGCGNVLELDFCDISDWSKKVRDLTGYELTDHQFNFYGYCKACKPYRV